MNTEPIMDYPAAWAFLAATQAEDHDRRCSYHQANRGVLCDCHVVNDEYDRRVEQRGGD